MIQEIITYMIIGAAIAMAVSQIIQKFKRKKRPEKKLDFKKETFALQHDCSDCSAECMLRNAAKPIIKENADLCNKIESQSKL
jgi:hypothetical protein